MTDAFFVLYYRQRELIAQQRRLDLVYCTRTGRIEDRSHRPLLLLWWASWEIFLADYNPAMKISIHVE